MERKVEVEVGMNDCGENEKRWKVGMDLNKALKGEVEVEKF